MAITLNGTTGITSTVITETSGGDVGVGTSSPSGKLHVAGGASNVNLYLSNDSYSSYYYQNTGGSSGVTFPASQAYIWDSGGTERMRIDSAGRVTMPYQPSFCALKSGNFTEASGTNVITGWSEYHDQGAVGGCFNASTGRFTAPVSGYYALHLNAMSYNTTGDTQWRWLKNGSLFVGSNNTTSGSPRQTTVSCVMYLSANDYAEPAAYSNATTSGITCYGGNYSHVSGYLIG